jgi:hypothetical protein
MNDEHGRVWKKAVDYFEVGVADTKLDDTRPRVFAVLEGSWLVVCHKQMTATFTIFRDVMLSIFAERFQCLEGNCCLHF